MVFRIVEPPCSRPVSTVKQKGRTSRLPTRLRGQTLNRTPRKTTPAKSHQENTLALLQTYEKAPCRIHKIKSASSSYPRMALHDDATAAALLFALLLHVIGLQPLDLHPVRQAGAAGYVAHPWALHYCRTCHARHRAVPAIGAASSARSAVDRVPHTRHRLKGPGRVIPVPIWGRR